ncbi:MULTISPECIES: phosphate signaling complex protein PhoU [Clostridiaceae]|uniref:Phosphate-specific transport system accessory protein PhoU n=1 Tax=Clostridium facile TaxID=2763035 RepID=A0ABR7ISN2_9CLOT|nr:MULTISPECIES: phosphate signaling complex protein PhoU [Clostridiaceae]MBC5788154.1 phosphate signaling complex protein PhoU [Clostridium facile]PWN00775.1 MAG: phosphate transport system regulatory protein PhoU [Massilioclostridium sp.]
MRSKFDSQLEELHVKLITMGSLCEEAISISAKLLQNNDEEQKQKVCSLEREIDHMERDIESLCMRMILQQQPVARDLRSVSAALKMISDMERIGDQAADISELAPYIADNMVQSKVHIGEMAVATVSMVTDSVEAFVKQDLDLAHQVEKNDDKVDQMFDSVKEELIGLIRQDTVDAGVALDLLMVAKYFERIGDHAVNLAECVEYSVLGFHKK